MTFAVTTDFTNGTIANATEVNANFEDVEDEFNGTTTTNLVMAPIGAVVAWLKSYTNTPQTLPGGWVECNGQTLDDEDSVYDTQTIPDLNGDNRFLRGNSTSEGTGGTSSSAHTHDAEGTYRCSSTAAGTSMSSDGEITIGAATATNNLPPYYNIVWIMRIK